MTTYLVLDIETIPDESMWQPPEPEIEKISIDKNPTKDSLRFLDEVIRYLDMNKPVHAEDIDKAADIARRAERTKDFERLSPMIVIPEEKTPFAPTHAHMPVAIGCVWLDANFHCKKVGCMKIGEGGEKSLLREWNDFMAMQKPTVVSWYGRGFDMPVLMLRTFRHGINMNWYFDDRDYRYRYSENRNCDLCDVMSDFGASRNLKLDAIAQLIGLPGKHDDVDGSQVTEMFKAGRLDDIATYCTDDTLQTAFVFLRWNLIKGRLDLASYQSAAQSILNAISGMDNLKSFRDLIRQDELLLTEAA